MLADQRARIDIYKQILYDVIKNSITSDNAKLFLEHSGCPSLSLATNNLRLCLTPRTRTLSVLSDEVPLVVSRPVLNVFAQELQSTTPAIHKEVAQFALSQMQPRVVSFEEPVC